MSRYIFVCALVRGASGPISSYVPRVSVLVRAEVPARIVDYEPETEASEGQLAVLKCIVEGDPQPRVVWTHGTMQVGGTDACVPIHSPQTH